MNAATDEFRRGEVDSAIYGCAMRCFIVIACLLIVTGCATSPMGDAVVSSEAASLVTNEVTAVHDSHSYARPEEVAVEHVTLDLEVNFQ
ncbi:MAG TPA: hypothetical protein VL069_12920, partial [Opitutus sp.]|nr:hypothetical protein [Opitutus sp.]